MSAAEPSGAGHGLRSVLRTDEDGDSRRPPASGPAKAVYIAEPEVAAPAAEESNRRRFSAGLAKRLTGRPAGGPGPSSLQSALSQTSLEALSVSNSASSLTQTHDDSGRQRRRSEHIGERLLAQVAEWLEHEKKKKEARAHAKRHHPHHQGNQHHHVAQRQLHRQHEHRSEPETPESPGPNPDMDTLKAKHRASSIDSDSSGESLDRLQRILDDTAASLGLSAIPKLSPRLGPSLSRRHRKPSVRSLQAHRSISSDTDYVDGDVVVPGCDVVLDNSKTVNYSESKARQEDKSSSLGPGKRGGGRERRAWLQFKNDIIRLAHTLKLKGWRQVPLEGGDLISVQRLSGALTNAVYVVTPPSEADLPPPPSSTTTPTTTGVSESSDPAGSGARTPRQQRPRRPEKLLLRIYGPQVEHLIDRDSELSVLRRLARKKIGPRMLGTFRNGRFEQFFDATTLSPADLREPETSCHIAKRMRELHDGVEILPEEEAEGPGVWKNWDRWVGKAEQIMRVLDTQILSGSQGAVTRGTVDAWKTRGLVCGVEWSQFKDAVAKVRRFIDDYYGDPQTLRERLVFAHNDTQYGNILRLRPPEGSSPLLEPENKHKQLIVIDFEYAAANTRGLEFANHFSEWMYDYHAEVAPHAFDETRYPTPDEQRRFVTAYVDHRPQHPYPEHHRRHRHHLYQHRPDHEASAAEAGGRADGAAISGSMTPGQTPRLSPQKPPMTSSSSSASLWMASHHRPNVSNDAAATASRPFSLGGPALNVEGGKGDAATQTQNGNAQPTEENGGSATEPSDTSTQAPAGGWREADRLAEEARESWIRELLAETRIWRVANSAQWVAWGIVQAKLPGIVGIGDADGVGGPTGDESAEAQAKQEEDETAPTEAEKSAQTDDKGEGNAGPPAGQENEKGTDAEAESADGEEEDVFDYLGYAQERALFFWGDCVLLGIIKEDELPEQLRKKLKLVDY